MKNNKILNEFLKGFWDQHPIFRQLLGMCPTLAVTTTALNGLAMGLAVIFVLTSSTIFISLMRKIIPHQVRIASFTLVIASFVTIADLFLAAKFPHISKQLGPYVPLIVVNCIILARLEAFASRNPLKLAFIDGLGMSIGFTWGLVVLGSIRELLSSKTIFGFLMLGDWFKPWVIMVLPAGAFITLGLLVAVLNVIYSYRER
jgi:electron transport complex protein RnfE